eukprot:TRINITY_DN3310_c0_g1_i2.p1 TRINITY_DN3310_c0_g1~~TRINITY_DN3310_c0_g1_i2.p1  ORF type:complete len:125 (+),score=35.18 TRINITY_DN3310_c0_g1_i2:1308-1682(+)
MTQTNMKTRTVRVIRRVQNETATSLMMAKHEIDDLKKLNEDLMRRLQDAEEERDRLSDELREEKRINQGHAEELAVHVKARGLQRHQIEEYQKQMDDLKKQNKKLEEEEQQCSWEIVGNEAHVL